MRAERERTRSRRALWLGFALLAGCGDDDVAGMQHAVPASVEDGRRSPQDAGSAIEGSGKTRVEPDAAVPADEPLADSGSAADAAADASVDASIDAGPLTGCNTAADCAIPEAALACRCVRPEDSAGTCYKATCVDHACGIVRSSWCPEERNRAIQNPQCTSDADCVNMDWPCDYQCRDGSAACLGVACFEGLCVRIQGSCGMEACPEGTVPAHNLCGACGYVGGCRWFENGCFPVCERSEDCGGGLAACLSEGFCTPAYGCD